MAGRPEITKERFEEAWHDDGTGTCVMCEEPHHEGLEALAGKDTPLIGDHPMSRDIVYHDHMLMERMLREAKASRRTRLAMHRFMVEHEHALAVCQERITTAHLAEDWFPRGLGEYMVQVHKHDDGSIGVHSAPVDIVGRIGNPPALHGHPDPEDGPIVH